MSDRVRCWLAVVFIFACYVLAGTIECNDALRAAQMRGEVSYVAGR